MRSCACPLHYREVSAAEKTFIFHTPDPQGQQRAAGGDHEREESAPEAALVRRSKQSGARERRPRRRLRAGLPPGPRGCPRGGRSAHRRGGRSSRKEGSSGD
ncbi:hypothetical protein NN561_013966 [Cricetulus griseus]